MPDMIPWRLKQGLRPAAFSIGIFAFRLGFRNPTVFRWLGMGWGNEGWSADCGYLEAVCRWASQVRGPILECGSGLTTLLLGIVAPGRVTSLEHTPEWRDRVRQAAMERSIHVNIVDAPLVDYGDFHWYSLPKSLPGALELIICDGPPSDTVGGRYGLLPIGENLLASNAVILMDDVERAHEQVIIARWKDKFGVQSEEHQTEAGAYAVVRRANSSTPIRVPDH